jgi:type IV pilus assembly protein PilO
MKLPSIKLPAFKLGKKAASKAAAAEAAKLQAALPKKPKLDMFAIKQQFAGLQGRPPGLWPIYPKAMLIAGIFSAVLGLGYFFYWQGLAEEWENGEKQEVSLKDDYKKKLSDAVNLEGLVEQRNQVLKYVNSLNKQLPSKAEMDALLSDINQAGVGRGLQFELFKPGTVAVKEYYAELPISVKVVGQYHDIGKFTSDIANMPRIVTLGNLNLLGQEKGGLLALEATAKTYRYLDQNEIDEQRRAKDKEKTAAGGAPAVAPIGGKK